MYLLSGRARNLNSVADLGLMLFRIVLPGVCLVLGADSRRHIRCVAANLRQPEELKQDRLDEKAAHAASALLSSTGVTRGKGNCQCRDGRLPSALVKSRM